MIEDTRLLQARNPLFVVKQVPEFALNIVVSKDRSNLREFLFDRRRAGQDGLDRLKSCEEPVYHLAGSTSGLNLGS